MKTLTVRLPAAILAASCALAVGQGTIYESKDKAGPVFSDQPSPGAKTIDLPPPNVIQVAPPVAPQPAPATPVPPYSALVIVLPANGDTIHMNTGAFDVRVRPAPALRTAAGDRIRIRLDGNLLAASYRSASVRVTAADWQGAAGSANVEHTLQAIISDRAGAVVIESAPVSFYAHRATVRRKAR